MTNNNTISNNVTNKATNRTTNNSTTQSKSKTTATSNVNKTADVKFEDWRIAIPSIELNAPISEGTSAYTMNKFVGHFENTAIWNGNVALAAHNRGYPVNYFANIKNLKLR